MKHLQAQPKSAVSVSDAAMDRARRALSKVAYAPAKTQQIARMAQMLPDVAVMAGCKHARAVASAARKLPA
jgi:hypothetical protein